MFPFFSTDVRARAASRAIRTGTTLAVLLTASLLLASCNFVRPPVSTEPPLPLRNPNLIGAPGGSTSGEVALLGGLDEAMGCLAEGRTVYGLVMRNTNIRTEPEVNGCRVGRVPRGTLVRIDSAHEPGEIRALINGEVNELDRWLSPEDVIIRTANLSPSRQAQGEASTPGYEEDVQPIFQRSCGSCHNGIARIQGLNVIEFDELMAGSEDGAVVVPGDAEASKLWTQIESGVMPPTGALPDDEQTLIREWIEAGAPQYRPEAPAAAANGVTQSQEAQGQAERTGSLSDLWLHVEPEDVDEVPPVCEVGLDEGMTFLSASLFQPISCGVAPGDEQLAQIQASYGLVANQLTPGEPTVREATPLDEETDVDVEGETVEADEEADKEAAAEVVEAAAAPVASGGNVSVAALGLPAPSDSDGWVQPRGGFCIDQRRPQNERSITAMAFAPDGRLFLALDSSPTGEIDSNVLYDAYHPSRSIVVYNSAADSGWETILDESSRITGLDWENGSLFVSRAGEVGRIPDGGGYERLAAGFAVQGQLFHANNGIEVSGGWVYVSAGGVRDGFSDGVIDPMPEAAALSVVTGGNGYASRLVRAPVDRLLSEKSIGAFQTAARGFRNPYGIAADPAGRIWVTDNGATNVPEGTSAGDEVNVVDVNSVAATGDESGTPFYGFPLTLNGMRPDWYSYPVVDLENTAAPTGITWAFGTVFFGQYGRNPGLYRLGQAGNRTVAERVMLIWPLLAVETAPDGALWLGSGTGGLYRVTPGCG